MIDHGQPIGDWIAAQKNLTADDRADALALSGVRTVGDLRAVLAEKKLPRELAAKIEKALKG